MSDEGLLHTTATTTMMDNGNGGDTIPQWKKELIQRRKNLAKTIGATVNMVSMLPSSSSSSSLFAASSSSSSSSSATTTVFLLNGNKQCSGSKDYLHVHTSNNINSGSGSASSQNSSSSSSRIHHAIPQTLAQKKIIGGHSHHINSSMYNSTTPLNATYTSTTTTTNNELITENKNQLHSSNGCERFGVNYDSIKKCSKPINNLHNTNNCNNNNTKVIDFNCGNSDNSCEIISSYPNTNPSCSNNSDKMVAAQEIQFDNFDDTSEELKYGPGIVSKLRCRYLSLALRQTNTKQRTSLNNLRRATSLNNLLDDDGVCEEVCDVGNTSNGPNEHQHNISDSIICDQSVNINNVINKNSYNESMHKSYPQDQYIPTYIKSSQAVDSKEKRSRQIQRGNDSLKRARSVEALVRYDSKAWERDVRKEKIESLIFDEAPHPAAVTIETKIVATRERNDPKPPKKIKPLLEENERPPADLVKEKLRLFESTANRKSRSANRTEVATKVASYKTIINNEKPPIIYPKPPHSPIKKPMVKARQNISPPKSPVKETTPTTPIISTTNNILKNEYTRPMSPLTVDLNYRQTKFSFDSSNPNSPLTPLMLQSPVLSSPQLTPVLTKPVFNIPMTTTRIASTTTTPTCLGSPKTPIADAQSSSSLPASAIVPPLRKLNNIHSNSGIADSPITVLSKKLKSLTFDPPAASPPPPNNNITMNMVSSGRGNADGKNENDVTIIKDVPPQQQQKLQQQKDNLPSSDESSNSKSSVKKVEVEEDDDGDDSIDENDEDDGGARANRNISKQALENISKAGTTTQFKFTNNTASLVSSPSIPLKRPAPATPSNVNSVVNTTTISTPIANNKPMVQAQTTASTTLQHVNGNHNNSNINNNSVSNNSELNGENSAAVVVRKLQIAESKLVPKLLNNSVINNNNNNSGSSCSSDKKLLVNNKENNLILDRPPLTTREIEKNLINKEKSNCNNLNINNSSLNNLSDSNISIDSNHTSTPLNNKKWGLKKTANHSNDHNTTMVFDFKDRKDIPDYIENTGIGVVSRRPPIPKGSSGYVCIVPPSDGESSTDSDDLWSMGPPSPCNVEFEYSNIVIDGKSSIRNKTRDVKYNIKFDDNLTSVFEYPSESCLIDDYSDTNGHQATINSEMGTVSLLNGQNSSQKLLGSMTFGSAPLGSYTPVKASLDTTFELGVTRTINSEHLDGTLNSTAATTSSSSSSSSAAASQIIEQNGGEPESLQYLKPASDDQTVAWSEGTRATDLLF